MRASRRFFRFLACCLSLIYRVGRNSLIPLATFRDESFSLENMRLGELSSLKVSSKKLAKLVPYPRDEKRRCPLNYDTFPITSLDITRGEKRTHMTDVWGCGEQVSELSGEDEEEEGRVLQAGPKRVKTLEDQIERLSEEHTRQSEKWRGFETKSKKVSGLF